LTLLAIERGLIDYNEFDAMNPDDLLREAVVFNWLERREDARIYAAWASYKQVQAVIASQVDRASVPTAQLEGALDCLYKMAAAVEPWHEIVNPYSTEGRQNAAARDRDKWEARHNCSLDDPETQRKLDEYAAKHSIRGKLL
jgi:hypothetical protein